MTPTAVSRTLQSEMLSQSVVAEGDFRVITMHGRSGLHALSRWSVARLAGATHTLSENVGSLTLWILPLEDLSNATHWGHFREREPDFWLYTLLSDCRELRDLNKAHFAIVWRTDWWRQLMVRFASATAPTHACHKPVFGPCDFHFRALRWYQIGVSWNRADSRYRLFVNGICVSCSNFGKEMIADEAGPDLYVGNTCFAIGELAFYHSELPDVEFRSVYQQEAMHVEPEVDAELLAIHGGKQIEPASVPLDESWRTELELSLIEPEHLDAFYIQGNQAAPRITPDGLLVETPNEYPPRLLAPDNDDRIQVYLHTRQVFEGDVAVEFDFMPLKHDGLALVMVHASGMQREDFMHDYPLRTTGSMRMVCWENVRNYHWEFWREVEGIRGDVATHAFFKNPWFRGLAYRAMPARYETGRWHRLQLVQDGRRWRGAVDGQMIFDVTDDPYANHGPTYHSGHVTLRNMWGSKFLWRNLRVSVRPPEFTVSPL